jgi:hypothetical protein
MIRIILSKHDFQLHAQFLSLSLFYFPAIHGFAPWISFGQLIFVAGHPGYTAGVDRLLALIVSSPAG